MLRNYGFVGLHESIFTGPIIVHDASMTVLSDNSHKLSRCPLTIKPVESLSYRDKVNTSVFETSLLRTPSNTDKVRKFGKALLGERPHLIIRFDSEDFVAIFQE